MAESTERDCTRNGICDLEPFTRSFWNSSPKPGPLARPLLYPLLHLFHGALLAPTAPPGFLHLSCSCPCLAPVRAHRAGRCIQRFYRDRGRWLKLPNTGALRGKPTATAPEVRLLDFPVSAALTVLQTQPEIPSE